MANSPSPAIASPPGSLSDAEIEGLMRSLGKGEHPRDLVKRLYPDDRNARRVAYRKLMRAILYDDRVARKLADEVQLELAVGLIPAARALSERAARRNVPASKLLLEATGVHNPRIRHEHSGEITVKFDIPRPKFDDGPVIEAEVVEEPDASA